jgi:integrase
MGQDGSGVTIRGDGIVLSFTYEGRRCRETLRLNGRAMRATPGNLKYAHKLRADIDKQLERGSFDYASTFPDSRRQGAPAVASDTFGAVAAAWLKSMGHRAEATRDQYRNAIELWKELLGESTPIGDLSYEALASVVGSHPWASAKSANNYLIALRGVFAFEYAGPRAMLNPIAGIRNLKVVKKLPDPLTGAERDAILAEMDERYDPRIGAYFRFAFFTGVRPEELIALRWEDVDEYAGIARLQRVRTFRGAQRDGSKTHAERDKRLKIRPRRCYAKDHARQVCAVDPRRGRGLRPRAASRGLGRQRMAQEWRKRCGLTNEKGRFS